MKIISICARGGSAGVPGKNIRLLCGKPLIAWTIEQALDSGEADHVFVSTDSEEIAVAARAHGAQVPFMRPAELATATAGKLPVIQHLVEWVEANRGPVTRIIDLDPTSPLRDIADIKACATMLDTDTDVVITGYEADKNPYFNVVEMKSSGYYERVCKPESEVVGRQLAPKVYAMNASIYVWHRYTLTSSLWATPRIRLHVMPRERSIDIDHPIDFDLVELLMTKKGHL
ncbi:N-acylneuraminate cytidylyltransferase/CMP-N,N'-diacetyllegionaminic acid synthase [Acidovorax sp. 69]|uniref:acylneuraminate cytidylyltransferase family protein n=1 Tax=Acidovorax sp. 69 TaxID=2035202 RepID=UPI000C236545|nr:acylneuraminate cytidylyltransferase family protein [Acidovorax sp. 69]PJI96816.1 N-acylneuraminate cytidylyltransferase/CMP-N,N'-diacetyllegionaminic acid synthase [Acidovorax sp. 69]